MKISNLLPIIPLIASGILIGCGGGGGGSASSSIGISGKVIDGYIQGATVCLDVNSNGICDNGEPSTTTDANGNYSLTYSGSTTGLQVLSSVPTSAYDSDDNGQTLAQAGKSAFTLMAPAPTSSSTETHVTPLSTLVSAQMLNSGTSSANAAASLVLTNLGMSQTTDLLNTDYVAAGNTSQHALAQVVASAIGAAQTSIANDSTFKADASGGVAQAGLVAIQYVIPSVTSSLVDNSTGSLKSSLGSTTAAISTATSTATSLASSSAASLAATTNLPATQSTLTLQSVLTTGFIVAQADKGNQYIDSNGNVQTYNTTQLQASYSSYNGSNFTSKQKVLIGGA
jgi:hypothetical protein